MHNFKTLLTSINYNFMNYLIEIYNVILLLILIVLGYISLSRDQTVLSIFLLIGIFFTFFNAIFLRISVANRIGSHLLAIYVTSLFIYLIYSGGVSNTGPLWSFLLPPVMFSIYGVKGGTVRLLLFIFTVSIMMFFPYSNLLEATYTFEFKIRIIAVFLVGTILSFVYEYSRSMTIEKLETIQNNLESYLVIDVLTGLLNRRGFEKKIEYITSTQGTMIVADIDNFKIVNDTYGHNVGDIVLKEVASLMSKHLRESDVAVRWGGEEFLIFLAQTSLDDTYIIVENIRQTIENTIVERENNIHITMSFGLAQVDENRSLKEAIRYADNAMYLSKREGRNKTTKY